MVLSSNRNTIGNTILCKKTLLEIVFQKCSLKEEFHYCTCCNSRKNVSEILVLGKQKIAELVRNTGRSCFLLTYDPYSAYELSTSFELKLHA